MMSLPNAHVHTPGHPLSHNTAFSEPELLASVHQLERLLSVGAATRARIARDRDQPRGDLKCPAAPHLTQPLQPKITPDQTSSQTALPH
jgi:hypothetical protein